MNVALTGGTGFLGRALVRLLVPQADQVRVLVRRPEADAAVRSLGAEPVRGDLLEPGGCDELVRNGDVVYHAAALVGTTGRPSEFHQTTVEGTRRLLDAALTRRPTRFVYVSTGAVYSAKHVRGGMSADSTPVAPLRHNYYARAKLAAENLVRSECERTHVPWTIVRLTCTIYGPGPSPLAKTFVMLAEGGYLYVIGSGRNQFATAYVDDAARAVMLAGIRSVAAGRIYDVASEEPVTQRQFVDAIADALGVTPPRRVARWLAYTAAWLIERWTRTRGREHPVTRWLVVLMSVDQPVDTRRIRDELGWRPEVSFEQGMELMKQWHEQQRGHGLDHPQHVLCAAEDGTQELTG